jgi:hypothetical protein
VKSYWVRARRATSASWGQLKTQEAQSSHRTPRCLAGRATPPRAEAVRNSRRERERDLAQLAMVLSIRGRENDSSFDPQLPGTARAAAHGLANSNEARVGETRKRAEA